MFCQRERIGTINIPSAFCLGPFHPVCLSPSFEKSQRGSRLSASPPDALFSSSKIFSPAWSKNKRNLKSFSSMGWHARSKGPICTHSVGSQNAGLAEGRRLGAVVFDVLGAYLRTISRCQLCLSLSLIALLALTTTLSPDDRAQTVSLCCS